jgi:hypothetical protein
VSARFNNVTVEIGRFAWQEYEERIYFRSHCLNIERNFNVYVACIFDVWDGEGFAIIRLVWLMTTGHPSNTGILCDLDSVQQRYLLPVH